MFLVSGVVKTLFSPTKNTRISFFFHHEQKRVKPASWEFLNRLFSLRKRREYILELRGITFFIQLKIFFIELVPYFFNGGTKF